MLSAVEASEREETSKVFERELVLERFLYRPPNNVLKMIVRLRGGLGYDALRRAVKKVCQRHPLLRSRVVLRSDGTAYFTTEGVPDVELKVRPKTSDDDYVSAIDEENQVPFAMDKGPLTRVVLLDSDSGSDILVYAHHVMCDGRSLVYVVRDLMEFLADPGKKVEVVEPASYIEHLEDYARLNFVKRFFINRINSKWRKRRIIVDEGMHREAWEEWFREPDGFVHLGYSGEETAALRERCRSEGVTINTALVTAALSAKKEVPELAGRADSVGFSVDIRDRLPVDPGDACGLYASGITIEFGFKESLSFWENARRVHAKAQRTLGDSQKLFERRVLLAVIDPSLLDAVIFSFLGKIDDPFVSKFVNKLRMDKSIGIILTNLGGLRIPKAYGPHTLENVVFIPPISLAGVPTVAASGILGKLDMTFPYHGSLFPRDLVQRFRDSVKKTLENAVRSIAQ